MIAMGVSSVPMHDDPEIGGPAGRFPTTRRSTGEHYYLQIMLPGAIVGAIVGYATQKHGGVRTAPA